jgi:sugar transferase (PEP-CTERM/EpsH1 system associated)
MRVLVLAHRIPYPPHTGDKLRPYQIARFLARRHHVTLAFLVDRPEDRAGVATLRRDIPDLEVAHVWRPAAIAKGLLHLAAGGSLSAAYFESAYLRRRLARRAAEDPYDVVYVSSSPMARYTDALPGVPVVMDFVDVDSDKWRQYARRSRPPRSWLYAREAARLQRFERWAAERAAVSVLVTPVEEALLRSFAPAARTVVLPNGVDLPPPTPEGPAVGPTLIFTGAMDYLPNVDAMRFFCEAVLPRIQAAVPAVRLLIVGLNPASGVRRLGRIPGVTVTGAVPDVAPYYARAAVSVAPLRIARGVQNKVLQAMAMGIPVVATAAAAQGLAARPGEHLLVADAPDAFAAAAVDLLQRPEQRRLLGRAGRRFVEAHHAWDGVLERTEALIESVVDTAAARLGSERAS